MSHHSHGYRIFPDDRTNHTYDEWGKADEWINGLAFKNDLKEAFALAKLGAVNCQFPFVVLEMPIGGKRPKLCDCWVVDP